MPKKILFILIVSFSFLSAGCTSIITYISSDSSEKTIFSFTSDCQGKNKQMSKEKGS